MNVVIAGDSPFSWALAAQLKGRIQGRLYFVLSNPERAMEASLEGAIVAVQGDMTDTAVLDQLGLGSCHTFVAGSSEDEANVLSALYARNKGATFAYACIGEAKFVPLLESLGITPVQTSDTAAAFAALGILKPAVSELVGLGQSQFVLDEIGAREFPELVGCRLGNLQGEHLHIIAVAQDGDTHLSYNTVIGTGAKLIIIYDKAIGRRLHQELRKVADSAAQRGAV